MLFALIAALALAGCGRDDDTITSYPIKKMNPKEAFGHDWMTLGRTIYKIQGQSIVSSTGGFIGRQDRCEIFDIKNWQCTYRDGSGLFGFRDGDYYESPVDARVEYVGRFRYHLVNCEWSFGSSVIEGVIGCPIGLLFGS